jgi:chorismate mutase-like protein
MSSQVEEIRRQIDLLDDKIHDLLMKRAELVIDIGKAKRKSNIQYIQPDREAIMLRRLLSRHQGPLPKEAIVRIWRELVGAVSLLQTGLQVSVAVDKENPLLLWDMAKDYFSSVVPMKKVNDPLSALSNVRDGKSTFAVLPWPTDDQTNPWWTYLISDVAETPMRIMARLPFGDRTKTANGPENKGIVVARVNFQPSGDDRSFIILELDNAVSRAKILETLRKKGVNPLSIYSCLQGSKSKQLMYHLVEIDSYIGKSAQDHSSLMKDLKLEGWNSYVIGGYPSPPVYEDSVGKGAQEGNIIEAQL